MDRQVYLILPKKSPVDLENTIQIQWLAQKKTNKQTLQMIEFKKGCKPELEESYCLKWV